MPSFGWSSPTGSKYGTQLSRNSPEELALLGTQGKNTSNGPALENVSGKPVNEPSFSGGLLDPNAQKGSQNIYNFVSKNPVEFASGFSEKVSAARDQNFRNSKLSNDQIALGNGMISLSNKQIEERNNSIALGNAMIDLSNKQIADKNAVAQNQFIGNLVGQARTVNSSTISVFSNVPIGPPNLIEVVPTEKAQKELPSIFGKYGNQNLSFSLNPKTVSTPKDTTATPASVLALDLNNVASKDFTGKYNFDLASSFQGFKSYLGGSLSKPVVGKNQNWWEGGPNGPIGKIVTEAETQGGSILVGTVKSTPPALVGLGTSFYNFARTGSTGGPATNVNWNQAFGEFLTRNQLQEPTPTEKAAANVLGATFFQPSNFYGKEALANSQATSTFIHEDIGKPINQRLINTPQPITNPQTVGAALGTFGAIGLLAAGPVKELSPFRIETFPLPYNEGVKPATGVVFGYGGRLGETIIGGRGGGKFYLGSPKAENLNLSQLKPTTTREGFESGVGTPIQNKVITNVAVPALEKSGKLTKTGALDILETGKEGSKLAVKSPTIQFRGFGEKPFRNLSPEQTNVLFNYLREKTYTVTGSTAEIPFTKEGLVSQARDIDIKGVPLLEATKSTTDITAGLNKVALPNQLFESKGTSIVSKITGPSGKVQEEKVLEFPQREVQEGYGLSLEEKSFVFGNKVPTGKSKVEGLKTVDYNFQGLRKLASSTELHIGESGDIIVRASSGREVKDPAHVFSFFKTKASNYLSIGKTKQGKRLNIIAENYRNRHPELDFEKEYRSVNVGGTLELTPSKSKSNLSLNMINSKNISNLKSSSLIPSGGSKNLSSSLPINSKNSISSATISKSGVSRFSNSLGKSSNSNSLISRSRSKNLLQSSKNKTSSVSNLSNLSNFSNFTSLGNTSNLLGSGGSQSLINSSNKSSSMGLLGGGGSSGLLPFNTGGQPLGTFGPNIPIPTNPNRTIPGPPILNLTKKKRKYKPKEGYTEIRGLRINNVFSSNLNIKGGL